MLLCIFFGFTFSSQSWTSILAQAAMPNTLNWMFQPQTLTSQMADTSKIKCQLIGFLVRGLFWLPDGYILAVSLAFGKRSSHSYLLKQPVPFIVWIICELTALQRCSLQNPTHWRVGFTTGIWGTVNLRPRILPIGLPKFMSLLCAEIHPFCSNSHRLFTCPVSSDVLKSKVSLKYPQN